jgi:hypothetical protein
MLKSTQPVVSSGVKCVFFFLMLAVFVWGLQTKLSHYRTSLSSSNSASVGAKLLTDKSVEHSANSNTEDATDFINESTQKLPVIPAIHVIPFRQLVFYQVELSLCSSSRYDSNGPNSMHLPPPTIS